VDEESQFKASNFFVTKKDMIKPRLLVEEGP
jgi:hypothetical protein